MSDWLTAGEAATRLGVKPATLYAYVSRGVLRRRRGDDGHSLFDAAEVERLALRGRPRRGPAAGEVVISSEVTALGEDRPYYRGRDATELAGRLDLERTAAWLWTADPAALDPTADVPGLREWWTAPPDALAAGRAARAGLSGDVLPLERLQVIVPALASADPSRLTLDRPAVISAGQSLVAGMVDCLPQLGATRGGGIVHRLWSRLTAAPPEPELVDVLRAALVVVADHELSASTLAARVAASVRADPYAVVTVGLGVIGGVLHGGASLGAETLLSEVTEPGHAGQVLAPRLRHGERIPGFGHVVYRTRDQRATFLLDRVRAAAPDPDRMAAVEALLAEAARRRLPSPNVEFALAALVHVAGMCTGAGEAIFAVGRTAGWLAHAMEEYERPTQLRLRAAYVGPPVS